MPEPTSASAVLFDLDGTFADTAPDMAAALNRLLARYDRPPVPLEQARCHVSSGSRGMLAVGFGLVPGDPDYERLRGEYLDLYAANIHCETCLFPGIAELVEALEARGICWGIVTNKPGWLTDPLLEAMALPIPPACVVSGDTAARAKPHPDPLFHACGMIERDPRACWYVGDDHRDILAGRAAGMRTLAALYGYLGVELHPRDWGADGLLGHPLEVLRFLALDPPRIDPTAARGTVDAR
ncbi:MAG: HAD family hydrolase [Halochromatium sp.]